MRHVRTLLTAVLCALSLQAAEACTVFAAEGPGYVRGGGTLIAKVRDEKSFRHTVKTVRPEKGYAYTGLFNGKRHKFNMGVNEKGFVVFRTTAGSVPRDVRRKAKRFRSDEGLDGQEFLVRYCATVDEALSHAEVYREPTNYMMADRRTIAVVEVLPDGNRVVRKRSRGVLTHTNHYIEKESEGFNAVPGESSRVRLGRINDLIGEEKKPFTMDDFISMTEDRNDGPDNSINRVGSEGRDVSRTLAVMVVHVPPEGDPEIHLKWRDDPADPSSWQEKREKVRF